jgi:ATP-dependent helicase/nuclease subunit A
MVDSRVAGGRTCLPSEVVERRPSPLAPAAPSPDQGARQRITEDLDTTLFVEAGAGSGKTSALVSRVVALVVSGRAELRGVAAITFTEKAGAELRDRIRRALERHAEESPDAEARRRGATALEQLDGAAIGTLHAFAQRLLSEHPVEAGLPPRVEVLDEVSSKVAFERRWSMFRDKLLADPALERTILLLLATGVRADALKSLAEAFDDNWDLVEERVPATDPDPPSVHELLSQARAAVERVCAEPCRDPDDKLRLRLDLIGARLTALAAMTDEVDLLEALGENAVEKLPSFRVGNIGRRASFDDIDDLRARVAEAGDTLATVGSEVANACARHLGSAIRRFTLEAAVERQRAGQLEFHDLLVLARALLRHPGTGRRCGEHCMTATNDLLLDEFQDTDPIQIELAVRIAAADPDGDGAGTTAWDEVEVAAGHLFIVGDPKQSIYRFRRADISTFLAAAERFGTGAGAAVELTANFRTVGPVIDWVNTTFATLMAEARRRGDLPLPSQPRYIALEATRATPGVGSAVSSSDAWSTRRPGWPTSCGRPRPTRWRPRWPGRIERGWDVDDGNGGWRGARLGDITVLVPGPDVPAFPGGRLRRAGIAFRAESSSLVYASRAVRDLLMVLRAVDDPTDYLRIVSALRTPLLACGDDDLFRFKVERQGRWSYLADQPDTVPARRSRAGRAGLPALALRRAPLAGPVRAARPYRPPTAGPWSSASPKVGPATCGAGCAS